MSAADQSSMTVDSTLANKPLHSVAAVLSTNRQRVHVRFRVGGTGRTESRRYEFNLTPDMAIVLRDALTAALTTRDWLNPPTTRIGQTATVTDNGREWTGTIYYVRDNGWPCIQTDTPVTYASGPEVLPQ